VVRPVRDFELGLGRAIRFYGLRNWGGFTLPPADRQQDASVSQFRALSSYWELFVPRVARLNGWSRLPAVRVFDFHQDGTPHMHAVFGGSADWADIRVAWAEVTGNETFWNRRGQEDGRGLWLGRTHGGVAGYMARKMSLPFPAGVRRWGATGGVCVPRRAAG